MVIGGAAFDLYLWTPYPTIGSLAALEILRKITCPLQLGCADVHSLCDRFQGQSFISVLSISDGGFVVARAL